MCWKQFSVYANAPRRILTLTNIRFVWKAGTGLKMFPQMIASPRYWKTEGAPSSEMRQTHTQTPLLSNQLHLHLELEAHSGGRLAAGFEVPLSNPPPAWREQKTPSYSTAKKKKGARLCVKHPSIPPSPVKSSGHICVRSVSVCVAAVCLCCFVEFGLEDGTAVLDVWECVYSCADADKPSSGGAGIRCMLISPADCLRVWQGLGCEVRYEHGAQRAEKR